MCCMWSWLSLFGDESLGCVSSHSAVSLVEPSPVNVSDQTKAVETMLWTAV